MKLRKDHRYKLEINKIGPKTEPYGTPNRISSQINLRWDIQILNS